MKKRYYCITTWFIALSLLILFSDSTSFGMQSNEKAGFRVEKIETGYWVIEAINKFNAKAMSVAFNIPNSGTKKISADQQVLGVKYALHNPGEKEIKIRRNDFSVNGNQINHFIVQEKTTQPLVVPVPPGKAIGITNYYIVDAKLSDIKDIEVIYSSVNKTYKKITIEIPLIQQKNN